MHDCRGHKEARILVGPKTSEAFLPQQLQGDFAIRQFGPRDHCFPGHSVSSATVSTTLPNLSSAWGRVMSNSASASGCVFEVSSVLRHSSVSAAEKACLFRSTSRLDLSSSIENLHSQPREPTAVA